MAFVSKREADAHDRIMEAAAELVELIGESQIQIPEILLEEVAIYLAQHAPHIKAILKPVKRTPFQDHDADKDGAPD